MRKAMIDTKTLTKEQLCRLFDHTNLHTDASDKDMEKLCKEAIELHAAMVAITSAQVKTCKKFLVGTDIHVGSAVSFPNGQTTLATKLFETQDAIDNGADEIDYVINITKVKNGDFAYIEEEMRKIVALCHKYGKICKVIFEICYLTDEEIVKIAQIAKKVKPDYIKTSTGWGTYGATIEGVRLMKSVVGDDVKVKAAGGIRTWETCKAMLDAGAERIGTSSAFKILDGFMKEHSET